MVHLFRRVAAISGVRWIFGGLVVYLGLSSLDALFAPNVNSSPSIQPASVAMAAVPDPRLPQVPTTGHVATGTDVQTISVLLPNGVQQVVIHDTRAQTMAVYHIEGGGGRIQLKSVRDLTWDLKMEHFNGQSPLPAELRQMQPK